MMRYKYFSFHLTIKPELNQSIYGSTNTDKSVFRIKDNDNKIKLIELEESLLKSYLFQKNNVRLYMFFD